MSDDLHQSFFCTFRVQSDEDFRRCEERIEELTDVIKGMAEGSISGSLHCGIMFNSDDDIDFIGKEIRSLMSDHAADYAFDEDEEVMGEIESDSDNDVAILKLCDSSEVRVINKDTYDDELITAVKLGDPGALAAKLS